MAETFAESIYEAELIGTTAKIHIARFVIDQPTNRMFRRGSSYWLDLCVTPRPEMARGCYIDRWGPHRFEKLGEVFLVPPGETLHVRSDTGGNQSSIVCELEASAVDQWLDGPIEWTDRRLEAGLDIAIPHIRNCLFRLGQEARTPGPGSAEFAEMIIGQLAIEVARYCRAIAEGPVSGGLASWRLRLIEERLHAPGPMPTLTEMAAICNISIRQLTRGFRTSRGCSIGDHIAQARIEFAKRRLASDDSIKTIAFELGFASPSSFSYAFRRATGSTPRQFRHRQLRKPV